MFVAEYITIVHFIAFFMSRAILCWSLTVCGILWIGEILAHFHTSDSTFVSDLLQSGLVASKARREYEKNKVKTNADSGGHGYQVQVHFDVAKIIAQQKVRRAANAMIEE